MDDFILLLNNKEECKIIKNRIEKFLDDVLNLKFNKKTNYFKGKQGVNFCGFKIYYNKIILLKSNKKKMYKKVKKWNEKYYKKELDFRHANCSLQAWVGHASHATNPALVNNIKKKCDWLYNEQMM